MMLRCRALHAQLRGATRGAGVSRLAGARWPCGASPARFVLPARALAPHVCGGKHVKKGDLPSKVCVQCNRPFNWRKKWESCWDEVKFCSDKCRFTAKKPKAPDAQAPAAPGAA